MSDGKEEGGLGYGGGRERRRRRRVKWVEKERNRLEGKIFVKLIGYGGSG